MRITHTESAFLQTLLPTEKIKSWALEVEMEETRERACKAAKSTSNSTSTKWLDQGSRETRRKRRSEEDTWRQSRSLSKHGTSPNRSYRSLQTRDRALPFYLNAHHADVEMLKTSSKSCHTLFDKDQPKERGRDHWKESRRGGFDCTNRSDQARRGNALHDYHKPHHDSNVAGASDLIRDQHYRETLQQGRPCEPPPAGHARPVCSRSYKSERKACNYEGLTNKKENVKRNPGSEYSKPGEKAWSADKLGHGEVKGCCPPMAAKSSNIEKEDGKPLVGMESSSLKSKEKSRQSGFEVMFASVRRMDVDAFQGVAVPQGSDTTSLQVEDAPMKNLQSSSSASEDMMELSHDVDNYAQGDAACSNINVQGLADNNAQGDATCFDTKNEYEMLASLLLDDSLDIDHDFDVTLAALGSALPDSMYCGSIFGEDLELPAVSMDTESVVEVRTAISAEANISMSAMKLAETKGPHLPAMCGFLEGREKAPIPNTLSSNDNLVKNCPESKDNGSKLAEKPLSDSAEARSNSRVFVDVTNTFEILDTSVAKEKTEEDDGHRISQRQKQVEFGKNTLGYERYTELVPRCKRKPRDPQTPNPKQVCSKRSWDGQIRKWRRLLHVYDPPHEHGEEEAEDFSSHRSSLQKDADSRRENTSQGSILQKGADPRRENTSQGFSDPKDILKNDVSLTIYDDWNAF